MTDRKPPGASWGSWVERQIHEAHQGGAFDDLVGSGRPIDGIGTVHDEMWWIKAKLRDEDIEYLPPTIAIRADRESSVDVALHAETEQEAREVLEQLNGRIRHVNSHGAAGPPTSVAPVDIEVVVERWRVHRSSTSRPTEQAPPRTPPPPTVPASRWRRWLHRIVRQATSTRVRV